eukprot:UN10111
MESQVSLENYPSSYFCLVSTFFCKLDAEIGPK